MFDTITRYLAGVASNRDRTALRSVLTPIGDRISSQCLTSAGLRIKGGSASAITQAHTVTYASVQGVLVTKALDTDMAALSGTVTNAAFNVYAHFIDIAGTLTTTMGVEGATIGAVKFPAIPVGKAMIGFTLVNPTGTGNFVGGTTQLDDGTVIPNAVFVNTIGAFDPTVLI